MDEYSRRLSTIIDKIRLLHGGKATMSQHFEAITLAQTALHETLGDRHPLMTTLNSIMANYNWSKAEGACRTILTLYEQGALVNPRLQIAKELEEDVIDIAERQWKDAEREADSTQKSLRLAVAAFLCGASLEDALRRLCDKHGQAYGTAGNTSIAKLSGLLYSPSKGVEIISKSDNAQIGGWGQTRNNADHGHFSKITSAEVQAMVIGVRAFIEKHLP